MIIPWSRSWTSISLVGAIALVVAYWAVASLVGGWWLHAGRARFRLRLEAVQRIEARKPRKQARDAHRAEQWRGKV